MDDYGKLLNETKLESDRIFESKITYISAGAIALSMAYVNSKIVIDHLYIIIIAWIILIFTLIANLYSNYKSSIFLSKLLEAHRDEKQKEEKEIGETMDKEIGLMNYMTIWGLLIGSLLIMLFVIINI